MDDFLIFQLAGPLAAWGEIAVGGDRATADRPTRSAVLGLVAAAVGVPRDDNARQLAVFDGYRVAVLTVSPGDLVRDYHTTQVPPHSALRGRPMRTRLDQLEALAAHRVERGAAGEAILSCRDYRCDGAWLVALTASPQAPYPMSELREALLCPHFSLYLGRKSCPPMRPLCPQVISAPDLVSALGQATFPELGRPLADADLYWEPGIEPGTTPQDTAQRWDAPVSRERWQFRPRLELHARLHEVPPCS
ncbi:MAG TPA: type I-E CRISPR-associated protein Cas5/CasD [Thermoanaerobaculales bacterium]|nr:type I-E CRISPR-associated protein Cas5/CasD [Thermoanaerobaculales bacterium]